MTQLTISLPDTAQMFINEQITNGTYTTVDDLFAALIEQAQERQAKQTVNAMLRSTLQKNKTIVATDDWWEQQRQRLSEQLPS
jgi:Arc/MetJ-type ribon-helix-helix transcriptional regulator